MLKFPPELLVLRGNAVCLLYVVGGLLMTLTAGGRCVEAAVRTAQDPAELLRLSNALIALVGLGKQMRAKKKSLAKEKVKKRLYFTESLNSLLAAVTAPQCGSLDFTRLLPGPPEERPNLESTCWNSVSVKRCRICYILFRGVRGWSVLALRTGGGCSRLKTWRPPNRAQRQVDLSRAAQGRGHVVSLPVGGHTGRIGAERQRNGGSNEWEPSRLSSVPSVLSIVLLWMFLPHVALCVVVLLGWTAKRHVHRAVLLKQ